MPSGAKKRKAAKKKLQKQSNHFLKDSSIIGSHSNSNKGSDEPKFRDERDGDGGDVEREGNVESGLNNRDDEGGKEVRFGEGNVTEEVKQQEEAIAREFQSVTSKSTSSSGSSSNSSSGSSSDDDEVVVEKEESVETESEKVESKDKALSEEVVVSAEYAKASVDDAVEEFVEERIPTQETVKQVVSAPEESTVVSESVPVDDVFASVLKQNVDEVIQSFEKSEVSSGIIDLVESKIEEKVMPVLDVGSDNTSEPINVTPRNDEEVLSQSSGVKAVEVEDNGKASETHKHTEEEPLLSPAPVTVRRTSWMNCCGLLEVFSGGAR